MSIKANSIVSGLMLVGQVITQVSGVLPEPYNHYILGAHIVVEAGLKLMAHFYNPDGTSARVSYAPEKK